MNQNDAQHCNCEGWWEQSGYGRQPMENLRLSFASGQIRGSGSDIVGPFVLSGIIAADGAVAMRKQYIGRHSVEYLGEYSGEGVMSGEWRIDIFRGRWMIAIRGSDADSATRIVEIEPGR